VAVVDVVAADIGVGMENIQEDDVDTDNSFVVEGDGDEEEDGIKVMNCNYFLYCTILFYT
jgi:hypothetical protein